jgi:hypothetical protein
MGRRRAKRGVWGRVAWATMALGVVCDVVLWGLWAPVGTWLAVAIIAFSFAVLLGKSVWTSTLLGAGFGAVLAGCVGLVAAFGWAGGVLVLMVAGTSPLVQMMLRTGLWGPAAGQAATVSAVDALDALDGPGSFDASGAVPQGGAASLRALVPLAGMPSAEGVPDLDDHALCEAWRRSYVRLEAARAAAARLAVVGLRQVYLDELVRRHPAEVRRWLESGARAAGNPLPFLERPVRRPQGTAEDGQQPHSGGSEAA